MSGPKCATVAPAAVSHHDYRAAQVEAARLALALALRVREERAIAAAKSRIESLVQQHAALRKRVDEARSGLPDLSFVLDDLPVFPDPNHGAAWQRLALKLDEQIGAWRASAEKAIAHAEYLQSRRERAQQGWTEQHALRDELDQRCNDLRELADALGETMPPGVDAGAPPAAGAECEEIESSNATLRQQVERVCEHVSRCKDTARANEALRRVVNRLVSRQALVSGDEALAEWKRSERAELLREFEVRLSRHFLKLELNEPDLPCSLQSLLADIRLGHRMAEGVDFWARTTAFVEKRRQCAQAKELVSAPPFMEDADLIERWQGLCRELDQVSNGLAELKPTLRRAYDDLQRTANERLASRNTRLAIQLALHESGFVAVERDDIQFDGEHGDHVLLGLPGYQEHCVMLHIAGDQLHWIPFRTNNSADRSAKVRDDEFDNAACSKLHRAADGLNSGQTVALAPFTALADAHDHPVLLASEMAELGIRIDLKAGQTTELKQASRDTGNT